MAYVYSTATCATTYAFYEDTNVKDLARMKHSITIEGGANVATKTLVTPRGIATFVKDADLELLESHPCFIQAVKNGFHKVDKKEKDIDKAILGMNPKDGSSPKTPNDEDLQGTTKVYGSDTAKQRR